MIPVQGYAAQHAGSALEPFKFERREPGPNDIVIETLYCGICHSDIHQVKDEWGGSLFPMVPGHEIVGRVARVGDKVKRLGALVERKPAGFETVAESRRVRVV